MKVYYVLSVDLVQSSKLMESCGDTILARLSNLLESSFRFFALNRGVADVLWAGDGGFALCDTEQADGATFLRIAQDFAAYAPRFASDEGLPRPEFRITIGRVQAIDSGRLSNTTGDQLSLLLKYERHLGKGGHISVLKDIFDELPRELKHEFMRPGETREVGGKTKVLYHAPQASSSVRRSFKNAATAVPAIKDCLLDCIERRAEVRLSWLGMSMGQAWSGALEPVVNWLKEKLPDDVVASVEVVMFDPEWKDASKVNPRWAADSRGVQERIQAESDDRVNISFYHYAHMPAIHGLLISDKYLFLGLCRWENHDGRLEQRAGDRMYEYYDSFGTIGNDRIWLFNSWLDYCKSTPTLRSPSRRTPLNS